VYKTLKILAKTVLVLMLLNIFMTTPLSASEVGPDLSGNPLNSSISGYVAADLSYAGTEASKYLDSFKVEIPGTNLYTSTDSNGYFELSNIPALSNSEALKVRISKPGYLAREVLVYPINGHYLINTKESPIRLYAGDMPVNEICDDAINISDIMFIASSYNTTTQSGTRYKNYCDVIKDDAINIADILAVARNFNKVTSDYPALTFDKPKYSETPVPTATSVITRTPEPTPNENKEKWIPLNYTNEVFSLQRDSEGNFIAVIKMIFNNSGYRISGYEPGSIIREAETKPDGSTVVTYKPNDIKVEMWTGYSLQVITTKKIEYNLGKDIFGENVFPSFIIKIGDFIRKYDLNSYRNVGAAPSPAATPSSATTQTVSDVSAKAISAKAAQALVLKTDGTVAAFGANFSEQCNVPVGLKDVKSISAGCTHSLALKEDGTLVGWGENSHGQCVLPEGITGIKAISAGMCYTAVLKEDGTVSVWGNNYKNVCDVPEGLNNVKAISAGDSFVLALKADGTVVSWGVNALSDEPVPAGLKDVVAISAGVAHSLALKRDGTVVAWGFNEYGQCNVPENLTDVIAIAAGGCHSVALKKDGTIVAWGDNEYGQCTVPKDLKDVTAISAAGSHTVALTASGSVVAWGNNENGQCDVIKKN
jgi:alpha-tubulin suppressor-like RCC1 family protein